MWITSNAGPLFWFSHVRVSPVTRSGFPRKPAKSQDEAPELPPRVSVEDAQPSHPLPKGFSPSSSITYPQGRHSWLGFQAPGAREEPPALAPRA